MESLTIIPKGGLLTMSSREIADLLEKQHGNIKISAERLAEKGVIGTLAVQEFTHNGNVYAEYLLNKRDSLILVAQNCPEFTARSCLLPYAQHQHAGYFEVKTGESNGHAFHQTRFTPAGVAWIAKRMARDIKQEA